MTWHKPFRFHIFRCLSCCVWMLVACGFAAKAAPVLESVHGFAVSPVTPQSKMVLAADGNYYGTTRTGGSANAGTVFKMTPAGSISILVNFTGPNGSEPAAGLLIGTDGAFYGTTRTGGNGNHGTIFRVTPAGIFTTRLHFTSANGRHPLGALIRGADGFFYGTTSGGGALNAGTFFRVSSTGILTTLISFNPATTGASPRGQVFQDAAGAFYGTTFEGGTHGFGTVFKYAPAVSVLVHFTGANGSGPAAGVVEGSDGNLYGTTSGGGAEGLGTIFRVGTTGAGFATVVDFDSTHGSAPMADLLRGADGLLYGTTSSGGSGNFGTIFRTTNTGALTTLVNFNDANGRKPLAGLFQSPDGGFYGTASESREGGGTVFRMSGNGVLATLAPFNSGNGVNPYGGLMQASDGNFYGTTFNGGSGGAGTVFKKSPTGGLTTLASFNGANGRNPWASMIEGSDGNLYGTTYNGGSSNQGTVFKVTPAGTLTSLASFVGTNGANPWASLVEGPDGNYYGTTYFGGASNKGTVFRITPSGSLTTLVELTDATGRQPRSALILASDGNFYGTALVGGSSNDGTIFRMTPAGVLNAIHNFDDTNGKNPIGRLVEGADGFLYGTTERGGFEGIGTVYRIGLYDPGQPGSTFESLYSFDNVNGRFARTGLVEGLDGNFYGTTLLGGALDPVPPEPPVPTNFGTVYRITPAGVVTRLANFPGSGASTDLILASDGNFYGTTELGGTTPDGQPANGQLYRLRFGPQATTASANSITTRTATLRGTVNPNSLITQVSFHYGTDPELATFATINAPNVPAGTSNSQTQASLTGLLPGTDYYFRVVAQNSENPVPQTGAILGFTTLPAPDITVEAPTGTPVANGSASLDFGPAPIGQAVQLELTVRNAGLIELTGLAVVLDGTHAANFSVGALPQTSLAGGESFSIPVTFTPSVLGPRSAVIQITSNDPVDSPFAVALIGEGGDIGSFYRAWAAAAGLSGADSLLPAVPYRDGVANILKYAFNLNGAGPDVTVLPPGGTAGLPRIWVDSSGPVPVFRVEYLRRKGAGLVYSPEISSGLDVFSLMAGPETVTPINSVWERVSLQEPLAGRRFARVGVTLPAPDISVEAPSGTPLVFGAATLELGTVILGHPVQTMVTIRNTGVMDLTGLSITLDGTHAADFSFGNLPVTVLAPGGSLSIPVTFTPSAAGARAATLRIASNDPDEFPFALALTGGGGSALSIYQTWAAAANLAGDDALPQAVPYQDGVANLVKYAFGLDGSRPDTSVLMPGGTTGLPRIWVDASGGQPVLRVEYVRRIGSGLVYSPEISSTLDGFSPMTAPETVVPINLGWERVSVAEPLAGPGLFARLKVSLP